MRRQTARAALLALLIAIGLAEFVAGRETFIALTMPSLSPAPPAYAWLAQQPPGALLELPLTSEIDLGPPQGASVGDGAYDAWPDLNRMRYQFFQTAHWQPIVDGYSGFRPPHHRELGLTLAHFPDERSVALLRGLGVTWVLVHSDLMEAFQPGRAAALRTRLEQTPGIEHVQDFGSDWMYRVQPAQLPAVTGQFWSTADGHAGLILTSADTTETVIPPDTTLDITGSWTPLDGGRATAFALRPRLPLIVGEGSTVTLDLPRPTVPGRLPASAGSQRLGCAIQRSRDGDRLAEQPCQRCCRSTRIRSRNPPGASRCRRAASASAGACSTGPTGTPPCDCAWWMPPARKSARMTSRWAARLIP